MKPSTAAQKLGIYLPAAPEEFQTGTITREELNALLASPPEWLVTLRADGPHPRSVVAGKLGVSTSGLARAGVNDALTSVEIKQLLVAPPEWLVQERSVQAGVRRDKERLAELRKAQAAEKPKARPADNARGKN